MMSFQGVFHGQEHLKNLAKLLEEMHRPREATR